MQRRQTLFGIFGVLVGAFFKPTIQKPEPKVLSKEEKEAIVLRILETPEGHKKLADALYSEIRKKRHPC